MSDRIVGRVQWYDEKRGYGFIAREGGDDVFVHQSAIEGEGFRTLTKGQQVEFDLSRGPRGMRAENVVKLS